MRREIPPLRDVKEITQKKRDAWWTVLLVDPVATPLVRWTAIWTRITPNQITWFALFLGLGAAACFTRGSWGWLLAGALLYHLSFVLDCMDGKLARLTGTGSIFGGWLDYVFDRIRVLCCAVALMGGQYQRTGDPVYLWLAVAVVFLDMIRYVDALQIFKMRHDMRRSLKARIQQARAEGNTMELAFMEDLLRKNPEADVESDRAERERRRSAAVAPLPGAAVTVPAQRTAGTADPEVRAEDAARVVDLQREFRSRFPWYLNIRTLLLRRRVRPHLISGIEFQMGVFIVAPVLNAVVPVTIVSGALLLLFELAIIYKLQLSTRDFERTLRDFDARGKAPAGERERPEQTTPLTRAEAAAG
ncbi:CDP-alcohol phosphatidyltransferase family protein [Streptomyces aidingensis]|uniref:CDP-alcohol phosphatidyltransferase n=1 Tax=Streptomyces aidingensis TaxID=910347 RepID=A0A1I1INH0_9ACTN|nr:CDP-alcohol phosphatidyltransferase family protein [Streptomyces aidingensis]SFC37755.1 CDP-alcohol phosphatidyltransferase [Streptomyces aidingensis]